MHVGDVVQQHRNNWPFGRVGDVIRSEDVRVRKVKVEIVKDGEKAYLRPIKELILLLPEDSAKPDQE